MSQDSAMLARAAAGRLVKHSVPAALLGSEIAGSSQTIDVTYALTRMAMVLIRAGWKPRVRVRAGRRVWSL
ncbi:hypothetical protein ACFPOB_26170 [Bosea eneae]|uniref:Uncharacterized protein n=1 Tax=Bosea eneae TaxID=151454 RepID=A0ABW0J1W5_9HYPH